MYWQLLIMSLAFSVKDTKAQWYKHSGISTWYKHLPPTQKIGVQIRSEAGRPGHQAVIGTGVILVIMLGGYQ